MVKRALVVCLSVVILVGLGLPALNPVLGQGTVTVTPNRDYINVRQSPAIGATVIGSMGPGDVRTATGRTGNNDWVRIDFGGREGWVGALVVTISGDLNSLPVGDPNLIPYNSLSDPSAGGEVGGGSVGPLTAHLDDSGVRMRSGPSTAYPVLANIPRYAEIQVTGRVESNLWVQTTYAGVIGWVALSNITLYAPPGVTINALPIIPPSADTGVRLSDYNARERFLVVDTIRQTLEQAAATLGVIEATWNVVASGVWPSVCSAPPVMEDFWLNAVERNNYPDLVEAVARLNQGIHDVNTASTSWLDACFNGRVTVTGATIGEGQAAVVRAHAAFDDTLARITSSKAVEVTAVQAHLDAVQAQFERIEAIWLDVRLGVVGEPPCINVPFSPGPYVLTDWERTTYPELGPLIDQINRAVAVLASAIQPWRAQCDLYSTVPGHVMPPEVGLAGYNAMLQTRTELNAARTLLNQVYAGGGIVVPAPSRTPDPTVSAILHAPYTPTFTLTPTPSFRYNVVATRAASAFHSGCAWYGVAGEIRNADGSPRPATMLHVFGPGYVDVRLVSGSDTRYGAAGFEVQLPTDAAPSNTYTVRIEDGFGNPLSPDQNVTFSGDCRLNVAIVTFTGF